MVFGGFVFTVWTVLSLISQRNSRAHERLARLSRPASLVGIDLKQGGRNGDRLQGIVDTAKALAQPLMPRTELEQSALTLRLSNAASRSYSSTSFYLGFRF